jgi:hypothetical protein
VPGGGGRAGCTDRPGGITLRPVALSVETCRAEWTPVHEAGVSGMAARTEVKVLTQSPDRGNLTPKRQLRCPGVPGWKAGVRVICAPRPTPARGRGVEAIGAQPCRAQAKRRKATWAGEPAGGGEARNLLGAHGVVATGWLQILAVLPAAFCRVPRER